MQKEWEAFMPEQQIVLELRARMNAGERLSDTLKWLVRDLKAPYPENASLLKIAFFLERPGMSIIGGWRPEGFSEVNDGRLDSVLMPSILAMKEYWNSTDFTSEGRRAVEGLVRYDAFRGGRIRSLSVRNIEGGEQVSEELSIEMVCAPRPGSPVQETRLRFSRVKDFDFRWSARELFWSIPMFSGFEHGDHSVSMTFAPENPQWAKSKSSAGCDIDARQIQAEFMVKYGSRTAMDAAPMRPMESTRNLALHTFEGPQAVDELLRQGALRDAKIRSYSVHETEDGGCSVELVCIPRRDGPVKELRLRFSGVKRFDFQWMDNESFAVEPDYRALIQADGSVYVSLDPFDYTRAEPEPEDTCVIEARRVQAEFVMKQGEEHGSR